MTNTSKTNKNNQKNNMNLSQAAATMRSGSASPEEKSRAASIMGHEGGKHRHDTEDRNKGSSSRRHDNDND